MRAGGNRQDAAPPGDGAPAPFSATQARGSRRLQRVATLESYIESRSDAMVTHSLCSKSLAAYYPGYER
jgi:hypothetical protein